MKNGMLYVFLCAVLLGGLAYLCSDKWFLGAGVGVAALACGTILYRPMLIAASRKSRLRHECYLFLHRYLITLSVTTSLEKAYETASEGFGEEFKTLNGSMETMSPRAKTEYLAGYFQSDTYKMFLSLLRLYLDRGGDVLKISGELMAEASNEEETEQSYEKEAKRKLVSYCFLWLVSLGILTFLRFGLSSFFQSLSNSWIYLGSVSVFFAFLLFSLYLFLRHYTGQRAFSWRKRHV
ncbi:MAG: hypothetical protein IJS37_01330 [Bacilli bacterium]|nr:hypothetical protein [Bacilli bacterium]